MSFNLFGPTTKKDIRVGYISTERGYVKGLSILEANQYAFRNPGTQFILETRDSTKYLSINEVNKLTPNDILPAKNASQGTCDGITGLEPNSGINTAKNPLVIFSGGSGVGAQGNPVIGTDGSLLDVILTNGGYGYKNPPNVTIVDPNRVGAGAVAISSLCTTTVDILEEYNLEEDFEEYDFSPENGAKPISGYGLRFGVDGEVIGEWDPSLYSNFAEDPIGIEIQKYQDFLKELENPWWHTRKEIPLSVTFRDKTSRVVHEVSFPQWDDKFMNQYAICPVPKSDVPGSDYAGRWCTFEWEENFPYTGEYIFRGMADNISKVYLDNDLVIEPRNFKGGPLPKDTAKKTVKSGVHRIKIDLLNKPANSGLVAQGAVEVFNTLDYIKKADRKLWRTNVFGKGGFLGEYGVCPFDTANTLKDNPYDGTHVIRWEHVSFPADGNYKIDIEVDDRVKLFIGNRSGNGAMEIGNGLKSVEDGGDEVIIEKEGFIGNSNKGTGKSTYTKFFKKGQYRIRAELYQKPGGRFGFGGKTGESAKLKGEIAPRFTREGGDLFLIVDGQGSGTINFSLKVDDNPRVAGDSLGSLRVGTVNLKRSRRTDGGRRGYKEKEVISGSGTFEAGQKYKIIVGGSSAGVGSPRVTPNQIEFLDTGGNDANATLVIGRISNVQPEQIKGLNPMALAIKITSETSEVARVSARTWNENPFGAALTIEAPLPPIPESPRVLSEGRCPENPTWTTRFPGGSEKWWPVTHIFADGTRSWSKFMNRYAISPIPPLSTPNSDGGGIIYSNSWEIDVPFEGFHGMKGTVDNGGRILVDGQVIMQGGYFTGAKFAGDVRSLEGFRTAAPKTKKFFLSKGKHTITVEVENRSSAKQKRVEKKIFSTQDWIAAPPKPVVTETTTESQSEEWVRVDDAFVPPTRTGRSITTTIPSNASFHRYDEGTYYKGKQIRSGGDWNDTNPNTNYIEWDANTRLTLGTYRASSGQRFAIAVWQKKTTTSQTTTTQIVNASSTSSTSVTKNGVTYSGPELFQINSPTTVNNWSNFMRTNAISPFISPVDTDNPAIADASFTFTWSNVNFPESGRYKVLFQTDNIGELYIDGQLIKESRSFRGEPQTSYAEISAGNYEVKVVCTNGRQPQNVLLGNNPMGFALKLLKDVVVSETSFSWQINPVGISAILIPPPCPKVVSGKGVVCDVIVKQPGNGYVSPPGPSFPSLVVVRSVLIDTPGINYSPDDNILIDGNPVPICKIDGFGRVLEVCPPPSPIFVTAFPSVTLPSATGVGFRGTPIMETIVVPEDVFDEEQLIQVTDLVGLKRTGYVNGKPYFGSVFSKDGQLYAGVYETIGELIPVYATLQESIDNRITTRPSAIIRQGTDVSSNDPRLNIPGTPQNLI